MEWLGSKLVCESVNVYECKCMCLCVRVQCIQSLKGQANYHCGPESLEQHNSYSYCQSSEMCEKCILS